MQAALYDTRSVEILAGKGEPSPISSVLPGPLCVFPVFWWSTRKAKDSDDKEEKAQQIPLLQVDDLLNLIRLLPEQHFTQPPPRYTDATLIRALEEYGIGRPSTYAPILGTIQERGYVRREQRRLYPTETGFLVNDLLVEHFPDLISTDFKPLGWNSDWMMSPKAIRSGWRCYTSFISPLLPHSSGLRKRFPKSNRSNM